MLRASRQFLGASRVTCVPGMVELCFNGRIFKHRTLDNTATHQCQAQVKTREHKAKGRGARPGKTCSAGILGANLLANTGGTSDAAKRIAMTKSEFTEFNH